MAAPMITPIRRKLVSRRLSGSLKRLWRADVERPIVTPELVSRLADVFDADLAQLGSWLGTELDCAGFHETTLGTTLDWASRS